MRIWLPTAPLASRYRERAAAPWITATRRGSTYETPKPVLTNRATSLRLPGFISDLKYLDVPKNPAAAFTWLQQNIFSHATEKQKQETLAWLAVGGVLLWLLSRS